MVSDQRVLEVSSPWNEHLISKQPYRFHKEQAIVINESYLPSVHMLRRTASIAMLVVLTTTIAMHAASAADTQLAGKANPNTPKLALQITVDVLRGDLPTRYYERLGSRTYHRVANRQTFIHPR